MTPEQPKPGRYCRSCGHLLTPNSLFCPGCGQNLQAGRQPGMPISHKSKAKRRIWPWLAGLAGGFLVLLIIFVVIALRPEAESDQIKLGDKHELADARIETTGGSLTVSDPGSALDGLRLEVPADAYDRRSDFTISETPVVSHKFGDLFEPAAPLITIDNGHDMADVPMTLTIPIQKSADEFAMAFYYERKSGLLEGIPCIGQDETTLTVMTAHFSDIVVTKVKKAMLDGRILSNEATCDFLPGMSDFAFPNFGSLAEDGGHCTGQSLAAIHYYNANAHDNYTGKALRGESRIDNGAGPDTPGFWEDDAYAYRFCSLLQREFKWDAAITADLNQTPESLTYYSFAYAMLLTHSPQIIVIYGVDRQGHEAGHAMIVFEVAPDHLAIADPNCPGDLLREIKVVEDRSDPRYPIGLAGYNASTDASSPGMLFTSFNYFGAYALYDFAKIDALWDDVLAGKDVAAGIFPADASFVAITGRDEKQAPQVSKLGNPMTVSAAQTALANPAQPDALQIALAVADKDARLTFYRGTEKLGTADPSLGQDTNIWFPIPLITGDNDIGILYEKLDAANRYAYVNFYRYLIHYSEDEITPTPLPATSDNSALTGSGFFGRWKVSDLVITGISGGTDAYWQDVERSGSTKEKTVRHSLANFNDLFASSGTYGDDIRYLTEIAIGSPDFAVSEGFRDKYLFQFNHVDYIGNFDVVFDGAKRNYRRSTLGAVAPDEDRMQVNGYEGCGGLDDDDMLMDLRLTLTDGKRIDGEGTVVINAHQYGQITVNCRFILTKISRKADLRPEYEAP